jgi:hypothetical protein
MLVVKESMYGNKDIVIVTIVRVFPHGRHLGYEGKVDLARAGL